MSNNNTYKSYDSMRSGEKIKMQEAYGKEESCSESSSDAPIERKTFRSTGFFGYPPYMILLLLMELCERFSFYGIRSVLAVYFTQQLGYTLSEGTSIYHGYIVACYMTPILGGIIADQYWGKYKTILILSIVYAVGNAVISFASTLAQAGNSQATVTFMGLGLIALGTGGIKPCVSSFCGDQLDPNDKEKREQFFNLFYFCINVGAIISAYLTPKLRQDPCMDKGSCYPLAFGVPSFLMFIALALFIAGTKLYIRNKNRSNVFTQFVKTATGVKRNPAPEVKRDSKRVLRILKILLPIAIFWGVFDQAGSTFTYQAAQLDKNVPYFLRKWIFMDSGWLLEDQIETMNPFILLMFIPLFNFVVYPAINMVFKLSALRKMSIGLGFNVCTCVFALWLQNRIDGDFTYVFPEFNPTSKIAKATLVFQTQYKQHFADPGENIRERDFVHHHLFAENMELYDAKFNEETQTKLGRTNGEVKDLIKESGKTSPRFWAWYNDTERQEESFMQADDYNSRLKDKSSCSGAWLRDLPHLMYGGHHGLDHTADNKVNHVPTNPKDKYKLPAGKFTKALIFPNGHMFPVDIPVARPEQGRSRISFYTRQKWVADKSYFLHRFYCKDEHVYSFQRKHKYRPCNIEGVHEDKLAGKLSKLREDGLNETQISDDAGFSQDDCQKNGGQVMVEHERNLDIGNANTEYDFNFSAGTDSSGEQVPYFLPEFKIESDDLAWPESDFASDRARSTLDAENLYRVTFLVPLKSECWYFPDNNKASKIESDFVKSKSWKIGTNGVYSMVDYTNPHTNENNSTDWSPELNVDIKPLKYSVLWQLVLYIFSTSAEVLISISGLEYSYAQAPVSMKAVVSSLWLLPVTMGNLYVMYVNTFYYVKTHAYKIHQVNSVVAIVVTLLFIKLAASYLTTEDEEKRERLKAKEMEAIDDDDDSDNKLLFGSKSP